MPRPAMCSSYDQSLRPRRSGSRKSWEARNPFGHGDGDSPGDQEQDDGGGRQEEDEEEEESEEEGGRVGDDDRGDDEGKELVGGGLPGARYSRRRSGWDGDGGSAYFYDRQLYLHSYQFRRKISVCDRLKGGIKRIKAAAWSIVSCKLSDHRHHYHYHYQRHSSARKFCKKLGGAVVASLKPRCIQVPD